MLPTHIILYTDHGMGAGADIDDGFALALAHADPNNQAEMATTINGNTEVESPTILLGVPAEALGMRDIPIFQGSATPLGCANKNAQECTPEDNVLALRDVGQQPIQPIPEHAAVEIAKHTLATPGEVTVVIIGPFTNIALGLILNPRVRNALQELVIM